MPTLDTEIGGASANSLVDLDEFATFIDERTDAASFTQNADARARALIQAMRRLNQESFSYAPLSSTQALKAPFAYTVTINGFEVGTDAIYPGLKYAQMELACLILLGKFKVAPIGIEPYDKLKSGESEIRLRDNYNHNRLPSSVINYLASVIESSMGVIRKIRG